MSRSSQAKRKRLNENQKLDIIRTLSKEHGPTQIETAREYGVTGITVRKTWNKRADTQDIFFGEHQDSTAMDLQEDEFLTFHEEDEEDGGGKIAQESSIFAECDEVLIQLSQIGVKISS